MDTTEPLRQHLRDLLLGGNAHLNFDKAVADLPVELRGATVPRIPHSPWMLVEHLRIVQRDILEFCRNPGHESPAFPRGYWPKRLTPPDDLAWDQTLARFRADLMTIADLVSDPALDLFAPIEGGDGQTLLKEALLVADHNSYHLGQLVIVRRGLGAWSE